MYTLFSNVNLAAGQALTLEERHHACLMRVLEQICATHPERALCDVASRLLQAGELGSIEAQYVPTQEEGGFDFLHLFFEEEGVKKPAMQLYAWLDHNNLYCIGIGAQDNQKVMIERIQDAEAYELCHRLIAEMRDRVGVV